jgi:hypothetical protein
MHTTLYICTQYVCIYICTQYICIYICIYSSTAFINTRKKAKEKNTIVALPEPTGPWSRDELAMQVRDFSIAPRRATVRNPYIHTTHTQTDTHTHTQTHTDTQTHTYICT